MNQRKLKKTLLPAIPKREFKEMKPIAPKLPTSGMPIGWKKGKKKG